MVVSADSQKIIKNKRLYRNKNISSHYSRKGYAAGKKTFVISRKPVSLFKVPFIFALFFFSMYISISDSCWQIRTPSFSLYDIPLPEEKGSETLKEQILKASFDLSTITPVNTINSANEKPFYLSSYTIREEDRFSIIANKFQIDLDSLLSVNNIEAGDKAVSGKEIKIPNISGVYYRVNKGDTLTSIAARYDIDIEYIRIVNNLYSSVIHAGEQLYLPNGQMEKEELDRIIGSKFQFPTTGTVKNNYGSYIDPVTGLKVYNYGIDIISRKGTAVFAARDGIVNNTSYNSYYGRVVLINHSGAFQSMYGCLDSIAVTPGQHVLRGELVGYIGNSGFKSGEHLQFSIFRNKEDVDTLEYIF